MENRALLLRLFLYPAIILFDTIPLRSIAETSPTAIPDAVTSIAVFVIGYLRVFYCSQKNCILQNFLFSNKKNIQAVLFGSIFSSLVVYMSYQVLFSSYGNTINLSNALPDVMYF